ncbi:MAG: hypothetical protein WCV91_04690 [Candidatus Margulisiibacteriota bacterium]
MKKLALLLCICFAVVVAGTAFAADKPEQVYAKYLKSLASAKSMADLSSYFPKVKFSEIKKMDKAQVEMIFGMLKASIPQSYKVKSVKIVKNNATMLLDGMTPDPFSNNEVKKATAKIIFLNEKGWKIVEDNWTF